MGVFHLTSQNSILKLKLHDDIVYPKTIALRAFYGMYLIPNITHHNNKIAVGDQKIVITPGQYNLSTLNAQLPRGIVLTQNSVTHRVEIVSATETVDLGTIGELLGFENNTKLEPGIKHTAMNIPKFLAIETLNIHCNVAEGMITKSNGIGTHKQTGIIATFKPNSEFMEPIIYTPSPTLYFPVCHNRIDYIELMVTNEKEELVDFAGATTTAIIEINI